MISPGTGDGLGNRPIGARDERRFARAILGAEDPMAMMAAYHAAFHSAPPLRHHGRSHLPGSSPGTRSTPERHGVSSHFFCRVKKVTALTPGAGKRSTVSAPPGTPTRVLHQCPGLRGPPRYPGCAWQSPNNHNVVVPRQRAGTLPGTGPLAKPPPRGKSVNSRPHSRFPPKS